MAMARSRCFWPEREVIMMIGRSLSSSSARIWLATSKPSMRGISMSSSRMSGVWSCNSTSASTPSLAVNTFMPLRSSRRLVTLRTVTESSTTITSSGRLCSTSTKVGTVSPAACWACKRPCSARMCASRSRISTTRPSPRMVAPEMPLTPGTCQGVYLHSHPLVVDVHQQHRQRLGLADQFWGLPVVQKFAQVTQLVDAFAVLITRRAGLVIGLQLTGQDQHDAFDGVQRHGVLLFAALHHQRLVH